MDNAADRLIEHYPWIKGPLIACAPMRLIALGPLVVEVSKAGGIGFIGAGSDVSTLETCFEDVKARLGNAALPTKNGTLPVGVGFLSWGADLPTAVSLTAKYRPAAVWLFAPRQTSDLAMWSEQIRSATQSATKIWLQVGTVAEALEAVETCRPDVLVIQGGDSGGHGLNHCASIVSLLPEAADALAQRCRAKGMEDPVLIAAGGISDGRGVAAAIALGAAGVVMGTRYLAASEANIAKGYRDEIIRASDGGVSTVRSGVYDLLRGTTEWPSRYGGRGVINQSYNDSLAGVDDAENKRLYEEAMEAGDAGWGPAARMTTYAGTAIGLVRREQSAEAITLEVREQAQQIMGQMRRARL